MGTAELVTEALYISTGSTYSGDRITPLVWRGKPTREQVEEVYRRIHQYEYDGGCPVDFRINPIEGEKIVWYE